MKRYTVLTYNFGGCEPIREVRRKDPDAEYILVTDDVMAESKTWTIVWAHTDDRLNVWEKCYDVRFHPFEYAQSDIVVRLDASIEIRNRLTPIIDEFERGQYDRCLMIHPHRASIPYEYETWCSERGYPQDQAADITYDLLRYAAPDERIQRINQTWFSMVVNHLFSDRLKVMPVSQNIITDGRMMQWYRHGTQDAIKQEPTIAPIMFGKKVETWR